MRLAVIGSRDFDDYEFLKKTLDEIPTVKQIVSGAARGADTLGERYANENGIPTKIFPAEWLDLSHPDADIRTGKNGKLVDRNAGFRRNLKIIDNADRVIAFWDGHSVGTKHAIDYAIEKNKSIKVVNYRAQQHSLQTTLKGNEYGRKYKQKTL